MKSNSAASKVSPLVGTLPRPCQRDLNAVRHFIHRTITEESPQPPVSADNVQHVLLTGGRGFMGRYLLHELLIQDSDIIIYCLLRSQNEEEGMNTLRDAMQKSNIWEGRFEERIRIIVGDLTLDRFGLEASDFDHLSHQIDAVYHLAGNVDLVGGYDRIREVNVLAFQSILHLCLRFRLKHLFHASTLGIFPEYVSGFRGEFRNYRIGPQAQPDLANMKRWFPLTITGYPWSKLVAEQIILYAMSTGIPAAIFRIPSIAVASTGFVHTKNFMIRMFAAALQVSKVPRHFSLMSRSDPVDMVCKLLVSIARNPHRRFTIYHCCDTEDTYHEPEIEDFGIYWKRVSFDAFRRACQALGEKSAMHGLWPLVDNFKDFWSEEIMNGSRHPIGNDAVLADCPSSIEWPLPVINHIRAVEWMKSYPEEWPFPVPRGQLDYQCLLKQTIQIADRMRIPYDEAYPDWLLEGLYKLVGALKLPAARIRKDRVSVIVNILTRSLRHNAEFVRERLKYTAITNECIDPPVFIIGINRTGTTFMHRLLARDPKFWTLLSYELAEPILPSGDYATIAGTPQDPRRLYHIRMLDAINVVELLAGIHPIDADEPEEDYHLLRPTFTNWTNVVRFHIPSYAEWLAKIDTHNSYLFHRRLLQHYTWRRRQKTPYVQRQWLLKMPFHLMELETLLDVYPNAIFIQTHRDPVQFMGSWNSLVERGRSILSEPMPREEFGLEQLQLMSHMLNTATEWRKSCPEIEKQWIDVRYIDFVDNPMGEIKKIYSRFDWPLTPEVERSMCEWLEVQYSQRKEEPHHSYKVEDYGLDEQMINTAFEPYLKFIHDQQIM